MSIHTDESERFHEREQALQADIQRLRIAAQVWQQQAEAMYEEYAQQLRAQGKVNVMDKITMIAAVQRLIEIETKTAMRSSKPTVTTPAELDAILAKPLKIQGPE